MIDRGFPRIIFATSKMMIITILQN